MLFFEPQSSFPPISGLRGGGAPHFHTRKGILKCEARPTLNHYFEQVTWIVVSENLDSSLFSLRPEFASLYVKLVGFYRYTLHFYLNTVLSLGNV